MLINELWKCWRVVFNFWTEPGQPIPPSFYAKLS